jgi:hypothetical protein
MSMSRWNPIYSYLLNLIMTCLGFATALTMIAATIPTLICATKATKAWFARCLRPATQADWQDADAVHTLYMATHRFMSQTLHSDSEAASDDDASDEQFL